MTRFERLIGATASGGLYAGGAAIVLMAVHITTDVLGKWLLNTPIPGTLELVAYYYMVACTFLPLALVQQRRENITADLASAFLGGRANRHLLRFSDVLTAVFFLLAGAAALHHAWRRTLDGETVDATFAELYLWPSRWFVVFGFVLAGVVAWRQIAGGPRTDRTADRAGDGTIARTADGATDQATERATEPAADRATDRTTDERAPAEAARRKDADA